MTDEEKRMGFSPCVEYCYNRLGIQYDANSEKCKKCDYEKTVRERDALVGYAKRLLARKNMYERLAKSRLEYYAETLLELKAAKRDLESMAMNATGTICCEICKHGHEESGEHECSLIKPGDDNEMPNDECKFAWRGMCAENGGTNGRQDKN